MSVPFETSDLQASRLFDVKGWVAIVTGGGTGLGLITAASLIANGAARVYITGRREDVLRNAARKHSTADGEIIPVKCDVTKKEDIKDFVASVRSKETFVNLLVNNAGIGGVKNNFLEFTDPESISEALFSSDMQAWNEVLHINTSAIYFTSAFLPLLVAAKQHFPSSGSIINVSSMSGITKQSQGGQFAYNSAKAATIALTQQLAFEFRLPHIGIRVNNIAPGFFPSEMTPAHKFSADPNIVREQWGVPLGRQGNAKEYAQTLLNLAANEYINGSTLLIDGGWLLEQS